MSKNLTELRNLTEREYRALNLESFSSLKTLLKNPADFFYYKENPFKGNQATNLGTAVHHCIQGAEHLVAVSEISRTTKTGREEYDKWLSDFQVKTNWEGVVLTKSQKENLDKCLENFKANQQAVDLLTGCIFEQPLIMDISKEISVKGKLDGLNLEDKRIVEIKTSSALTTAKDFSEGSKDMCYDMQAYMYREMVKASTGVICDHYFIVINTTAPFACKVYKSSQEYLDSGKKKFEKVLDSYKKYVINKESIPLAIEEI